MGVSQSLPSTAYIKMIDVWMVVCILYPFTLVVLYSVQEVMKKRRSIVKNYSKQPSRKWNLEVVIEKTLDWGLPFFAVAFTVVYWGLGLANYTWSDLSGTCNKLID